MPSDLIYREDAKDYARHAMAKGLNVLEYLEEVPAADFRPVVRGKWISTIDGKTHVKMAHGEPMNSCRCSVCGEWLVASDEYAVKGNFCPNCGAIMEES